MNQSAQQNGQPQRADLTNLSFLCRMGQETVQEIVCRTTDMMNLIKAIQLPNGTTTSNNQSEDRKNKLKNEYLKSISMQFKRLYKIYEKCLEANLPMEDVEPENLIPIEGREVDKIKMAPSDSFKEQQKEYNEQLKILKSKNAKIKEIIDRLREIVWEVNTMLAMRGVNS